MANKVKRICEGFYHVTFDTQQKVDCDQALKALLRLPIGKGAREWEIVSFLQKHAFALPHDGVIKPVSVEYFTEPGKCTASVFWSDGSISECDAEKVERMFRGEDSDSLNQTRISSTEIKAYRDLLIYVAGLFLVSEGYGISDTSVSIDGEQHDDAVNSESVHLVSYAKKCDEESCTYEASFIHMPNLLAKRLFDMQHGFHDEVGFSIGGLKKVSINMHTINEHYQGIGSIWVKTTPENSCWNVRHDRAMMHRVIAGCLFLIAVGKPEYQHSINRETLMPEITAEKTMMGSLYDLATKGKIAPCGWCGKPVIGETYCNQKLGRCRKNDSEEAHLDFERGLSADEIEANHPKIKKSTIEKWFRKGQ